jgi:hypothetical protein
VLFVVERPAMCNALVTYVPVPQVADRRSVLERCSKDPNGPVKHGLLVFAII